MFYNGIVRDKKYEIKVKPMKKDKIRILMNPSILFWGALYSFVCVVLCVQMIYFFEDPSFTSNAQEKQGVQLIFVILAIGVLVAALLCLPRWLTIVEFSGEGIRCSTAFRKGQSIPYSSYPYVYIASYKHRTVLPFVYKTMRYIVVSQRKLTPQEQQHINLIKISAELVKVRYSK